MKSLFQACGPVIDLLCTDVAVLLFLNVKKDLQITLNIFSEVVLKTETSGE